MCFRKYIFIYNIHVLKDKVHFVSKIGEDFNRYCNMLFNGFNWLIFHLENDSFVIPNNTRDFDERCFIILKPQYCHGPQ